MTPVLHIFCVATGVLTYQETKRNGQHASPTLVDPELVWFKSMLEMHSLSCAFDDSFYPSNYLQPILDARGL